MTIHAIFANTYAPVLGALSQILDKAAGQIRAAGKDPETLLELRLAADMHPLKTQIRFVNQMARDATKRLAGTTPPAIEGDPATLAAAGQLFSDTAAFLGSLDAASFAGAAERRIEFPLQDPLVFDADGTQYLCHWSLPNFYFHIVTAYNILRHHGIDIGKRDYMSHAFPFVHERDKS